MQIYRTIKKTIAPFLEKYGFHLLSQKGGYDFRNEDGTRLIQYDFPPLRPRFLRITISVLGEHRFSLELSQFKKLYNGHYDTQAELDDLIISATQNIVSVILPYIDSLVQVYIEPTDALYHLLSVDPKKVAMDFLSRYSTELSQGHLAEREMIRSIVRDMQPSDILLRKEWFQHRQNEIIAVAAFLGERHLEMEPYLHWGWSAIPELSSRAMQILKPRSKYGLILSSDNTSLSYDALNNALYLWNFCGIEILT